MNKTGEDRMVSTHCPNRRQPLCPDFLRILGGMLVLQSCAAFADVATVTVPANTDATLDEAFTAGYVSGVADYAGLLAATDLIVGGAGRLIIDKDLKTDGYAGEVHVSAGSRLQLRVSGALGDKAHGTFVADGATLETWTDGAANTLNFLGEPLTFAGTGVDGDGALVSLTTANAQRRASWGGTILTMTGDAMVHLKNTTGKNMDFPDQVSGTENSLDMNGHTLTFCGPFSTGMDTITLPIRLNVTNPGHVVASNGLYVSMNNDNILRGSSNNTFTIAGSNSRLDLYQAKRPGNKFWTLIFAPEVRRNAFFSSSGGGIWDGPVVWQGNKTPYIAGKATSTGGDVVFAGRFTSETGMEVTNTTSAADYNLYPKPTLSFTGKRNRIGGVLKASDMEVSFDEPTPDVGGIEIVNTTVSVNKHGIAGLWKGVNRNYLSWNDTTAPSETRLREDFMNNYRGNDGDALVFYTNSIALGPDVVMNATKPNYNLPTLVTYKGYLWNTGGNRVITFLTHVHGYVRVIVERTAGTWNGPLVTDVAKASSPTGVRLSSNGAYKIAIIVALHDGNGGANAALSGDDGILYCWGSSTSSSTDPADYMPLMDPGDGSLFTRYIPGTDEYDELGIYGTEPFELTKQLTCSAGATLSLEGANYSVGAVTGAVTVLNAAMPHIENTAFTITDELACHAADLIAGDHLSVTGALKFAQGAMLTVTDSRQLPQQGDYVVAEASDGITGMPVPVSETFRKITKVYLSGDGTKLMARILAKGTLMTFR